MNADEVAWTEDQLLAGRVVLRQPKTGHRAGTDAVLLACLSGAQPGETICDLGSASGAVGLMIAAQVPDSRLVLVEREPPLVDLARENIRQNGLDGRAMALELDVFADPTSWPAECPRGAVDLVVTNPPFFEDATRNRASPDRLRRRAHVMEGGGLSAWLGAALRLLKPRGRIAVIHRADALAGLLAALQPGFGSLVIRAIQPRADKPAGRVLVWARRGGRAPLTILPPLVLHGEDGRFTPEAERLHGTP